MIQCKKSNAGFTLVEVLVVISIIGVLSLLAVPAFEQLKKHVGIQNDVQSVLSTIRTAQNLSLTSQNGSAWGVHFGSDEYVLYSGTWPHPTSSIVHKLNPGISVVTGVNTEITFLHLTGTSQQKSISIGKSNADKRTISVNPAGSVTLQ